MMNDPIYGQILYICCRLKAFEVETWTQSEKIFGRNE